MTTIINIFGGPGTGKSSCAANVFALLKAKDLNVELVREYVKDFVWENRQRYPMDQIYIMGKQMRREQVCLGKVDYIVTDSPVDLSFIYEQHYDPAPHVCGEVIKKYKKINEQNGHTYVNIFLHRVKKYNPNGRYQDEEGAKLVDRLILDYLKNNGIYFVEFGGTAEAPEYIVSLCTEFYRL